MDEPTAALSRKEVDILFETIAGIKAQGIGIIYISHKLEEVKEIGDRITVMRDGRQIATMAADEAQIQQIINLMIGKELERVQEAREKPARDVLFEVDGLVNDTSVGAGQLPRTQGRDSRHHGSRRVRQDGIGASAVRRRRVERRHGDAARRSPCASTARRRPSGWASATCPRTGTATVCAWTAA